MPACEIGCEVTAASACAHKWSLCGSERTNYHSGHSAGGQEMEPGWWQTAVRGQSGEFTAYNGRKLTVNLD